MAHLDNSPRAYFSIMFGDTEVPSLIHRSAFGGCEQYCWSLAAKAQGPEPALSQQKDNRKPLWLRT